MEDDNFTDSRFNSSDERIPFQSPADAFFPIAGRGHIDRFRTESN